MAGHRFGGTETLRRAAAAALALALMPAVAPAQDNPLSWGYGTYGTPGLIDMPSAMSPEDAELSFTVSNFSGQLRNTLTFQVTPRLTGSFRYSRIEGYLSSGGVLFDRSFSLHYRFLDEGTWRPAMAVGINDIVGTGVYGGEYVVASKTLTPRLRASLGLGWGRLGSYGGFTNPLGVLDDRFKTRPAAGVGVGEGGNLTANAWFRGDAAVFGGLEWQATDRLRLMVEYSSDAYAREAAGGAVDRRSPLNFGLSYEVRPGATVQANYLYGSEVGLQLTMALNPRRSPQGSGRDPAPPPVVVRPPGAAGALPLTDAGASPLERALAAEGLRLNGARLEGRTLHVEVANERFGLSAQAVGRAARVLTAAAPAGVETFAITLSERGMPVSTVTIPRGAVEALEFASADALRAQTTIADAPFRLPPVDGRYPRFDWDLAPYLRTALFDPDDPLRADVGAQLSATFEVAPGLVLSGRVQQKLFGNLDASTRESDSVLPRVRSEAFLYDREALTVPELTAAWYFRPGPDLYGRVTVGYLESMFGGVSAEVLWKPQDSRLALGAEINRVRQRDFDQRFGFRDYEVTTGNVSAYYDLGRGYMAQLDVGRYLAGDVGATVTLAREFANGWRIAAFATKTDVSAAEFGEGSFDKGIQITVPLDWIGGKPTRAKRSILLRPVQRDGGARLDVSGRLYETVRGAQAREIDATWARFWK